MSADVLSKLIDGSVAARSVLFQRLEDDVVEIPGQPPAKAGRGIPAPGGRLVRAGSRYRDAGRCGVHLGGDTQELLRGSRPELEGRRPARSS